jgi:HSP20 family protein
MLTVRSARMFPEAALLPEVTRLMDTVLGSISDGPSTHGSPVSPVAPAINAYEDADGFRLEAELPGYGLSDVTITMEGQELTIAGSRSVTIPDNATPIRRERSASTSFSRTIRFGVPIDAEKITARLDAGVLHVLLPKAETARARRIEVRGS